MDGIRWAKVEATDVQTMRHPCVHIANLNRSAPVRAKGHIAVPNFSGDPDSGPPEFVPFVIRSDALHQNGRSSSVGGGKLLKSGGSMRLPLGFGILTSGAFSVGLTSARPSGWMPLSFQLIQTVAVAA